MLLVVGTPLGNLQDVAPRVLDALKNADFIYAEDTRRTRILLEHFGINKTARSLHTHNEIARTREVLEHLEAGETVALVSDAGTPAVSDPGADVVAAAHAAKHRVSPVVGPSALTAALSVAGFSATSTDVLFAGFLPARGKELREAIERVAVHRGLVVLFESPHRLAATLQGLAEAEAERPICMCRELTKMYEEVRRCTVSELAAWAASSEVLGEITLVLGPSGRDTPSVEDAAIDAAVTACLRAGLSARDTASAVAAILNVSKRVAYERCTALKSP